MTNPPLPQAPLKPTVREDTPWPSAGKMSGDLFKERDWLVPKGYVATQNKEENIDINSLKEEPKVIDNSKKDKCRWGPNCPFCKAQERKEENLQQRPLPSPQTQKQTKTKSQQLWEAEMERLTICTICTISTIWTASQTRSWTLNLTKARNIIMNMGMRH